MRWLAQPTTVAVEGDSVTFTTLPDTDFWQVTHYGFIRDSGHFYFQEFSGDFVAEVKVIGAYKDLYDQAGLMVRLDEHNWMKCGVEYVHGVQQASVVVTREVSDWSVNALPGNPPALWLRIKRGGDALEVFYSLDGAQYAMLRLAYFPTSNPVQVGLMAASPQGGGYEVRFEGFSLRSA